MELNGDEMFNGPNLDTYGWNRVNGATKWNWVSSATYRAPWDIVVSGIWTLNSGPAFGHLIFGGAPEGACCYGNFGGVYFPKKNIAYNRLDLRVSKTFKLPWGHEFSADFELFNVFNTLNRSYSTWGAGAGDPAPRTENSQVGADARAFQAGLRYKF
jgi:hypothetical protein